MRQISKITETAKKMNPQFGITGIIAFYVEEAQRFKCIQYVEGPESNVDQLLQNIKYDERIKDTKIFTRHVIHHRLTPGFTMRFCTLSEFKTTLDSL